MGSMTYDSDHDFRMWWLIQQTWKILYNARVKDLSQYGITAEEAAALFAIHTVGTQVTPAKISRWLFRKPQSTFGLLRRMEKEGLVKMVKDLNRKNLVRVTMTEKGQQSYSQAAKRESIHRMMSVLSEKEYQLLESYLIKLREKALEELTSIQKPVFSPMP